MLMVKVMDNKKFIIKIPHEEMKDAMSFMHRGDDRRKVPSKGFTNISVVGWICRRERCRRKDDKMDSLKRACGAERSKDKYPQTVS